MENPEVPRSNPTGGNFFAAGNHPLRKPSMPKLSNKETRMSLDLIGKFVSIESQNFTVFLRLVKRN